MGSKGTSEIGKIAYKGEKGRNEKGYRVRGKRMRGRRRHTVEIKGETED